MRDEEGRALLRSRRSLALAALAVVVLAVASVLLLRSPAGAASTILTVLKGQADVSRAGAAFAQGNDGDVLNGGDKVRTREASNALATFFDGSTIEIEPQSEITIDEVASTDGAVTIRLSQAIGRTWSSIHKFANSNSRYEVKTPAATAAVRGTGLDVTVAADGTTTVKVTDGTAFVAAQGVEVQVGAGQQTTVAPGSPPAPATPAPPPPAKLRFGLHSPAFLAVVLDGRTCGIVLPGPTVVRQIPGCLATEPGVEPQLIDLPDPGPGNYQLVISPAGAGGDFTVTATGLAGDALVFNSTTTGSVKPGEILGSSLPVEAAADGRLVSSGLADPVVIATSPVEAVLPSPSPGTGAGGGAGPGATPAPLGTPNVVLFPPLPNGIGFSIGPAITPAPVAAASPSPTPSPAPTPTPTPAPTPTPTPAPTPTPTPPPPTPTPSPTPAPTPTASPTPSATPSPTPSPSPSPTPTRTPRPPTLPPASATPTPTPTGPTPTPTAVAGGGTGSSTATASSAACNGQPTCTADAYGYTAKDDRASSGPAHYWLGLAGSADSTRLLDLDGADDDSVALDLPFAFPFYGRDHWTVYPSSNGTISLSENDDLCCSGDLPEDGTPAVVAPFWDDLELYGNGLFDAGVYYATGAFTFGASTIRWAAFEWKNIAFYSECAESFNFEVVLYSDGRIDVNYATMAGHLWTSICGSEYAIGIQDDSGGFSDGGGGRYIQYAKELELTLSDRTIRFYPPGNSTQVRPPALTAAAAVAGQPLAPTGVSAIDTNSDSGGSVTVSWTPSTSSGVTQQRIYYVPTEADGDDYVLVKTISGNATSSTTITAANASGLYGLLDGNEYSFVVRAWNGTRESGSSNVATAIPADDGETPMAISSTPFLAGTEGFWYSETASTTCYATPCLFSLTSGTLPPGLTLHQYYDSFFLQGTPLEPGSFGFTIEGRDAAGNAASQPFTIAIGDGIFSLANSTISGSGSVTADGDSTMTVTVTLRDANDDPVAGETVSLDALSSYPVSAPQSTGSDITDSNGQATFSVTSTLACECLFRAYMGGQQLISYPGAAFLAGTATTLQFTDPEHDQYPWNVSPGASFRIVVFIRDDNYNRTTSTASVTLSKYSGPGALGGTTTVAAVNGFAVFSVSLSSAGDYELKASASGLFDDFTATITAGDASAPAPPVITTPLNGAQPSSPVTISGTAEASATVHVRSEGDEVFTVVANGSGAWTYAWSAFSGAHTLSAFAEDAAGNLGRSSAPVTIYVP